MLPGPFSTSWTGHLSLLHPRGCCSATARDGCSTAMGTRFASTLASARRPRELARMQRPSPSSKRCSRTRFVRLRLKPEQVTRARRRVGRCWSPGDRRSVLWRAARAVRLPCHGTRDSEAYRKRCPVLCRLGPGGKGRRPVLLDAQGTAIPATTTLANGTVTRASPSSRADPISPRCASSSAIRNSGAPLPY